MRSKFNDLFNKIIMETKLSLDEYIRKVQELEHEIRQKSSYRYMINSIANSHKQSALGPGMPTPESDQELEKEIQDLRDQLADLKNQYKEYQSLAANREEQMEWEEETKAKNDFWKKNRQKRINYNKFLDALRVLEKQQEKKIDQIIKEKYDLPKVARRPQGKTSWSWPGKWISTAVWEKEIKELQAKYADEFKQEELDLRKKFNIDPDEEVVDTPESNIKLNDLQASVKTRTQWLNKRKELGI